MVKQLAVLEIFNIASYNIGTPQGLRCSGHLRCSNSARKSNSATPAVFDFKRTIAKKAELRKITRPSQSSNLRKGFLHLPACQSLSLWERWHCEAMTERASPARKSRRRSDRQALCQSDTIAVSELFGSSLALSVSLRSPAPPKGEPLTERLFPNLFREFVENARLKRKEFVNVIKMRRRY